MHFQQKCSSRCFSLQDQLRAPQVFATWPFPGQDALIHHAKNSYKVPESQDTANDEKPHGTSHTSSSSFRSALRSTAQASSAFWFWIHLGRKLSRLVPELAMPMWSNMIQYKPISLDVLGSESHSSIDNLAIVLAPHILVERKVPPCSVRTGAGPDADRASNFKLKPVHFKMKLQHRPQHIVPGYSRPNLVMARWLLHWWPIDNLILREWHVYSLQQHNRPPEAIDLWHLSKLLERPRGT